MTAERDFDGKLARIGQIVARNADLRAVDAARVADGSLIDGDDFADARAQGLTAARAAVWRTLIPQRFHTASLDDWSGEIRDALTEWAERATRGANLILIGPVGTGKTHAAIAAARLAHDAGLDVRYWQVGRLLDALRPGPDQIPVDDVIAADRIILDDVGVENPSGWTTERFEIILDARWADEQPTIITTNLTPDGLRDRIGERTYDRLAGDAVSLRLSGESRRRTPR